jgi:uncharacterized membrane protein YqjE
MPTRAPDREQGLGAAAKEVAERASTLVRLEIELAKLELARRVKRLALGLVFGAAAALLVLFGLGFLFAGVAAGIATATSTWVALLAVAGGLILGAGLLGVLAVRSLRSGVPVPKQAIEEARRTSDVLRSNGR